MYAVSQGAMAVECRGGDERILSLLNKIHDHASTIECVAERAFLWKLVRRAMLMDFGLKSTLRSASFINIIMNKGY